MLRVLGRLDCQCRRLMELLIHRGEHLSQNPGRTDVCERGQGCASVRFEGQGLGLEQTEDQRSEQQGSGDIGCNVPDFVS